MSFKSTVKGHELAFVSKLLAIFGAVEEKQMRELFSHLNDSEYGKIMTRMDREGLFYRTPEAKYLTSTRILLDKVNIQSSVACFWAFLELKDRIRDFCAGEMPAIITMAAKASDYDLIPVTGKNTQLINDNAEDLPENTVRFLVTRDLHLLTQIERRMKNDYADLVDENGDNDFLIDSVPVEDNADDMIYRQEVWAAFNKCKEKYTGIVLRGIEALELKSLGYTTREIAERYNTTINSVNAWISRARVNLKTDPDFLASIS